MADPRLVKLADVLVNYSVNVKRGEWVLLFGNVAGLPLVREVHRQVLQAGGNASIVLNDDVMAENFFKEADEEQLSWVNPESMMLIEQVDVMIALQASSNTRVLNNVDPAKQQLSTKARGAWQKAYAQRSTDGSLRWVLTQFPCDAFAQDAGMSLSDWEDFVYGSTYADTEDPVAEWQRIQKEQDRLVQWLDGRKEMTVQGANIDLKLSIEGRKFKNSCGHYNMPDGEIFTSPVEDSINGWVNFTFPAIRQGREVDGVEFKFEDGKVVDASAKKNNDFLMSMLNIDSGARYLGEFAIGTNYSIQQFTRSILYDEKIGGTVHMAVGYGFPELGSKNESNIHWDFICDMREDSEIRVDGELLYKDGQFQV